MIPRTAKSGSKWKRMKMITDLWIMSVLAGIIVYLVIDRIKLSRRMKLWDVVFTNVLKTITAQKEINEKQHDINNALGSNLEILGVHTKLIPPSVAMEAEAFLRWVNEKRENKDG